MSPWSLGSWSYKTHTCTHIRAKLESPRAGEQNNCLTYVSRQTKRHKLAQEVHGSNATLFTLSLKPHWSVPGSPVEDVGQMQQCMCGRQNPPKYSIWAAALTDSLKSLQCWNIPENGVGCVTSQACAHTLTTRTPGPTYSSGEIIFLFGILLKDKDLRWGKPPRHWSDHSSWAASAAPSAHQMHLIASALAQINLVTGVKQTPAKHPKGPFFHKQLILPDWFYISGLPMSVSTAPSIHRVPHVTLCRLCLRTVLVFCVITISFKWEIYWP